MNIHRIPEYLLRWGVTLVGIVASVLLIQQAGYGNYGKITLAVTGFSLFALVLLMRENIWLLLPVVWVLTGQIPELGIPLTVKDLMVSVIFCAFLAFRAFKLVNRSVPWDSVSVVALLMVLYVVSCWIRNPVGVAALNSDRVGGKPYFNLFIALLAYWVLCQCSLKPQSANRYALVMVVARGIEGVLAQLIVWFPVFRAFFDRYYSCGYFVWAQSPDEMVFVPGAESTQRLGYLAAIGTPLGLYLVSAYRPLALLNLARFWRPALLGVSVACLFLAGFRSSLASLIAAGLVAAYFWGRWREVWKVVLLGAGALVLLILGNGTFYQLPYSAQRALTFLPGNWDRSAIEEAKASTDWRLDMWKEMLGTDRYIENKMFGDGFGFKKRDLEVMAYMAEHGSTEDNQMNFMISGGVHSGPVSSIRYVGYVGLAMILTLQVLIAMRAWKLILRARFGPYRLLAFFLGIPCIIEPVFFVFIFGAFENAVPEGLFSLGMLTVLQNSLDEHVGPGEEASQVPVEPMDLAELPEFAESGLQISGEHSAARGS